MSLSLLGGLGLRPLNPTSDHPRGLALDFMVTGALGDQIAEYAVANRGPLAVSYVIWNRRIWTDPGRGWRPYSGYSPHTDHVHISFDPSPGPGLPC